MKWLSPGEIIRRVNRSINGTRLWTGTEVEAAVCFPTSSGGVARLQELPFQIAVARACNTHFAQEYNALSKRVSCVGVLPMRSPQAAAQELRRAVTELGLKGFEIVPTGLPLALGDTFYDPLYAEAERLGVVLGIHGTRGMVREMGASGLTTFSEVHSYMFPAGILLQFTSMICQGVPVRFPNLKIAFLEIGATWLPYYLDRLDEHWEKRAEYEMPLLNKNRATWCEARKFTSVLSRASLNWFILSITSAQSTSFMPLISHIGTTSFQKIWKTAKSPGPLGR